MLPIGSPEYFLHLSFREAFRFIGIGTYVWSQDGPAGISQIDSKIPELEQSDDGFHRFSWRGLNHYGF